MYNKKNDHFWKNYISGKYWIYTKLEFNDTDEMRLLCWDGFWCLLFDWLLALCDWLRLLVVLVGWVCCWYCDLLFEWPVVLIEDCLFYFTALYDSLLCHCLLEVVVAFQINFTQHTLLIFYWFYYWAFIYLDGSRVSAVVVIYFWKSAKKKWKYSKLN